MLVSAAVCPHPPILVPEAAGEAAPELDGLRAACDDAVGRLLGSAADALIVVGGAPQTRAYGPDACATLRPYGLSWTIPGDPGAAAEPLPLSLSIGRWLLERLGAGAPARYEAIAFDAPPGECLALGRRLAESAGRVALLVMGDGTACRSEKAPGYLDERAAPYDETVARALERADATALAALDPALSRELQVAGRAAWQVLAGAVPGTVPGTVPGAGDGEPATGEDGFSAALLADEAPYGVGYLVAAWSRRRHGR